MHSHEVGYSSTGGNDQYLAGSFWKIPRGTYRRTSEWLKNILEGEGNRSKGNCRQKRKWFVLSSSRNFFFRYNFYFL
jgi:hypothetical protein